MFLGEADDDQLEDVSEADEESSTVEKPKSASFLCLQMEFCQNKTLRSLIDYHQLYLNPAMVWRLFKEILLGLEFMHSYNLIHRDIKPGNVFLDSNWSVKIGDFGLATRLASIQPKEVADKDGNKDKSFKTYSMTKDIGTYFYMPPEAKRTNVSKMYGEKFDIYSTGIVLFEMILKPPESRSERVSCLERLRNEFVMPDNYLKYLPEEQQQCATAIIKWCLHENPEERPSASELLQSELLPVTISEEDALHKSFVQIAQDPKHRFRRLLFNELFAPVLPSSISILYDKNYCIEQHKRRRQFMFNSTTIEFLSTFFRSQGFNYVPIASLIPSAENYSTDNDLLGYFGSLSKPYKVIDENGVIIQLPTNLRQNLARYISHSNIQRLRSFSIDRIHSQSTSTSAFSSHPDARTEFCVDIVRSQTTNANSVAIEILQLIIELSQKLRPLSSTRWQIILNHTDLIKAVGIHYSISEHQRLCSFFNLLYDFSSQTEYSSLAFEFSRNFNMSDKHANELIQLIDTPTRSIHKLRENLRPIINNKNIRSLIEHSIGEMDLLFQNLCHNLDASLELTFLPSFVYQPLVFNSGLLFSLRVEILDKGKKFWVPIVGGGDYNSFLQKTRQLNEPNASINACAFGFNLSVENVAHLLKNTGGNVAERFGLPSTVLINCTSIGYLRAAQELANQLREQALMSVELSNEEIAINDMLFEYCRDKFINFIVTLVGSNELVIYVNSFDKSVGNNGFRQLHNRISLTECLKLISSSTPRKEQIDGEAQKSVEAERFESSNVPTNATLSNVNLIFCISRSFKVGHHTKKKYESVAYSVLQNLAKRFNKSIKIDAYITELPPEILTQISNLDRSAGHDRLFVEFETIANSQARYKTEVKLLYDEMETFLQQQPTSSNQVVFLFCPRHSETFYRIIM
ncbi:Protein kinase domain-containing protein [Aphelenchoides bicaudatus]|nr:Protein kinase domain-containing protein [Aphelenchoides bicaudatus]